MKIGTVVVSVTAFVASLGAVTYLNPGIKVTPMQAQPAAQAAATSSNASASTLAAGSRTRSASRQQASVAPLARTRGS